MGLSDWLRKQATALVLATASVEKNALGQKGESLDSSTGMHQRLHQGRLSDDLLRGELTQQVKEIRWRTYKVLKATDGWRTTAKPIYKDGIDTKTPIYDDEGFVVGYHDPIIIGFETDATALELQQDLMRDIKVDSYDDYPLDLVLLNEQITDGMLSKFFDETLEILTKPEINEDGDQATHGSMSSDAMFASNNDKKPLVVERQYRPRIEIERFTKKMVVRHIKDSKRLLEFYVSKYPDEYDKRTSFVIAECKKVMNGWKGDMTDIQKVGFISYKTIGVPDFRIFEYEVTGFDKVIEFDGYYVFKFNANLTINGEDILEEFIEEDLDERYKNKEKK